MRKTINIRELLSQIDQVEGYLTPAEQVCLLHLPAMVDHIPGDIVEIGSFHGKSTISLGMGVSLFSKKRRTIYCIDPFGPHFDGMAYPDFHTFNYPYFDTFCRNIMKFGLENGVKAIKKFSTQAYHDCPDRIAILFIDGDHRYESVKHDFVHYAPKVVKGGIIAFHDYGYEQITPGVKKAVDELCLNDNFEYICDYNSIRLFRKQK